MEIAIYRLNIECIEQELPIQKQQKMLILDADNEIVGLCVNGKVYNDRGYDFNISINDFSIENLVSLLLEKEKEIKDFIDGWDGENQAQALKMHLKYQDIFKRKSIVDKVFYEANYGSHKDLLEAMKDILKNEKTN